MFFLFFSFYILHRLAHHILELNSDTLDKTACKWWLSSRCLCRTIQTQRKTRSYNHDPCGLEIDDLGLEVEVDRRHLRPLGHWNLHHKNRWYNNYHNAWSTVNLEKLTVYSGQPREGSGPSEKQIWPQHGRTGGKSLLSIGKTDSQLQCDLSLVWKV
jgi:hypothetical protein